MAVERLHHVQLAMPEGGEVRAREFYEGLLGIPEVPKPLAPQGAAAAGSSAGSCACILASRAISGRPARHTPRSS